LKFPDCNLLGFLNLKIVGLIFSSLVLGFLIYIVGVKVGFPICKLLGVGLGFLVSRLLWLGLGFPICIIFLKFGDVVSLHGYLNVFVYSLYAHKCQSLRVHSTPTRLC